MKYAGFTVVCYASYYRKQAPAMDMCTTLISKRSGQSMFDAIVSQ